MKQILLLVGFLTTNAGAQNVHVDRQALAAEMNALTSTEWRPGVPFGQKLASLPGSTGYEILRENWRKGASVEARKQMFKGWVFNNHPDVLKVLHLGATDPSTDMQNWAFTYLKNIAFVAFAENFSLYLPWAERNLNRPLDEVRAEGLHQLLTAAMAATGEVREQSYRRLADTARSGNKLQSPLALELVREIFATETRNQDATWAARNLLMLVEADDHYLYHVVRPGLESDSPGMRTTAILALMPHPATWVDEAFVATLKQSLGRSEQRANMFMLGQGFAERKDPRHIPLLIGAIAADNTYDTVYGLGYFGLRPLTGVSYDKSHDGAWWIAWWEKNKARFPEEVRKLPIPDLKQGR